MEITEEMLNGWVQLYFWPFLRIGALVMTAPLFNSQAVAPRARLMLALTLTLVLAPLLPKLPPLPAFGAAWWLAIGREFVIGAGLGLMLQLVFEAVMLAGELVSYGMGLGFAQLADPLHGAAAPMLGQFYQICAILLFLSLGGHLRLVELLSDSFHAAPLGGAAPPASSLFAVAQLGTLCFAGALRIALPAVIALLLVNLSFGVMNRSAPALNALSIGFPLSLIVGLVVLRFTLPQLQTALADLLDQAWNYAAGWAGGLH
ncbi:MAG: flagellar biosynthetic protein FliR [Nevskia sp.]|nr:flagellar biosynthetic protein FliR [Nevskia sp.]